MEIDRGRADLFSGPSRRHRLGAIGDDAILQFARIFSVRKCDVGDFYSPRRRPQAPFLVSALLPYCYILFLGIGMLVVTLVSGMLQAVGQESVDFLRAQVVAGGVSGALLYLLGFAGEIFVVTSIYLVMPVGRLSRWHALMAASRRQCFGRRTRHALVWYFATLSQVGVVYGSLTTAIVVLLTLELAATVLLLGAQVISEYERIGSAAQDTPPQPLSTH